MKERPILFSAPMVRAILEGRKTQTRRVVKRPPRVPADYVIDPPGMTDPGFTWWAHPAGLRCGWSHACPYGKPGDRLWVRETWGLLFDNDPDEQPTFWRADYTAEDERTSMLPARWRPSIHMPRARSRISLEVTYVRVERLQEITEEDARAEGIFEVWPGAWHWQKSNVAAGATARDAYGTLWQMINGFGSLAANPWVWVVEFKPVTQ